MPEKFFKTLDLEAINNDFCQAFTRAGLDPDQVSTHMRHYLKHAPGLNYFDLFLHLVTLYIQFKNDPEATKKSLVMLIALDSKFIYKNMTLMEFFTASAK